MDNARKLIDQSAEAGVDAVKFQTKDIETSFSTELLDSPYTGPDSFGATYREHKYAIELTEDEYSELNDYAISKGLNALDRLGWKWADCTGIIATWGPSHFEIFNELVDRGVKRILCEKPFANSVARCVAMLERSRREGVTLGDR